MITPQTNYIMWHRAIYFVLAGLAYISGKAAQEKKENTLEELELEKQKIFQAIGI